jgi:glyoxylase-like metal-dependent hydrolase (beta-lactamase superfamily II)
MTVGVDTIQSQTNSQTFALAGQEVALPDQVCHFQVGNFDCLIISDSDEPGRLEIDAGFANMDLSLVRQWLQTNGKPTDHFHIDWNCLFVNTGRHRVVIDTGIGDMDPTMGRFVARLKRAGVDPDSVDVVVLSHGDADRIGGTIDPEGKLTFSKARHVMCHREWAFWASGKIRLPAKAEQDEETRRFMRAWRKTRFSKFEHRLSMVANGAEIVPGIIATTAAGHTPGHMVLKIESARERFWYGADLVHHPMQVENPGWCSVFDYDPERTEATRIRILSEAAEANVPLQFVHMPFPGVGRVVNRDGGLVWVTESRCH